MKLRKMTKKDLKHLAKIDAREYKHTTEKQSLKVFSHLFKNKVPGACLIAEEDGEIIGYLFAEKKTTFIKDAAGIQTIWVTKKRRGRGVGTALIKECLKAMRKHGIKSVSLTAREGNKRALSLYGKFGFKPFRTLFHRRL